MACLAWRGRPKCVAGLAPSLENVILLGPSRVGKTHIAISLGYLATQAAAMPDGGSLDCFLPDPQAVCDNVDWQLLRQRSGYASTFVASLELAKQGEVVLAQAAAAVPIHVGSRSSAALQTHSDQESHLC